MSGLPRVSALLARASALIGSRAVVRNVQWLFLEKVLRMALGVVVGAWVARYLGPERFGVLAYVTAYVAIFQAVCQLGLDSIVVRDVVQTPDRAAAVLGTTLRLRIVVSVVGFGTALMLMAWLRPGDRESLLLTAVVAGGLLFQVADTVDLWFQSQLQSRLSVAAKVAAFGFGNGARVVAILAGAGLPAFGMLLLLEAGLGALALAMIYRKLRTRGRWSWDLGIASSMMRDAWPLLLAALAVLLYMRLDQILLRELVGERDLGLYAAAQQLSVVWYFIPMIVCSSAAPGLARLHAQSRTDYLVALRGLFSFCWALSLAVTLVIVAGADLFVGLLFGPDYADAAAVLRWHAMALVPVSLGIAQSLWITHERRTTLALYRTALGFAVSLCLNLILIPRYGAEGSAIAYLCCQLSAAILSNAVLAPEMLKLQLAALWPRQRTT